MKETKKQSKIFCFFFVRFKKWSLSLRSVDACLPSCKKRCEDLYSNEKRMKKKISIYCKHISIRWAYVQDVCCGFGVCVELKNSKRKSKHLFASNWRSFVESFSCFFICLHFLCLSVGVSVCALDIFVDAVGLDHENEIEIRIRILFFFYSLFSSSFCLAFCLWEKREWP